jgi:two-component system alkaline phosphatase synthesis response regulator PhoP
VDTTDLKILLVDDEADILEFLGYNLAREGYHVEKAKNGKQAIQIAREFKPHLVILDVMMPEMDGMETCNAMRNMPELNDPLIVFLTARGEDYSQIAGFDAGADDYITKPIKPKLFLSRIQALLRRIPEPAKEESFERDLIETSGFVIDKKKYVVIRNNEEISLPKKEFELLSFLASRPDRVVTRDEIFSAVWGDDVVVGDRTIDVHIRRIRERLDIENIRTIKGVGYKFEVK